MNWSPIVGSSPATRTVLSLFIALVALVGFMGGALQAPFATFDVVPLHPDGSGAAPTPSGTSNPAASTAACGSMPGTPAVPQILPAVCVNPQILCVPSSPACASHPDQARVQMWANATGNTSYLPWVQVVFVVETTVYDGVYDSSQGDYGDGVNGADPCGGPCEESDGVPYFITNVGQIAQGITENNVGSASSDRVTFSMVDYFSAGNEHDDGDGSEYNVDVSTFEPASTFATAVTSLSSNNALFGDYWEHSPEVYDDSDFSDTFLATSMISGLYGSLHGSGLNWVTNSSTYHVIVWIGSTVPRDPNYQVNWCVTYNDWANACPDLSATTEPSYTYASGLKEPAGENISDIITLAQQEHVVIDTIDLPDGMDELGSKDLLNNTAANSAISANNIKQVLSVGCHLAEATGGSWEGPTPGSSGIDFRCPAAATGNDQGNLTNTFRAYKGGSYTWSTDPSLGWALTNIKFPSLKVSFPVIGYTKEDAFQFIPSSGFVFDKGAPVTFDCINNGTVITAKCQTASNSSYATSGWGWAWPLPAMYPDDMWSATFTVNVTSPYPTSQINQTISIDGCDNTTLWSGCPGGVLIADISYNNLTQVPIVQTYPPAFVDVVTDGAIPTLSSVSVTPPSATLTGGANQSFTATPSCTGGSCPSGASFTWAMTNASAGWLNTFAGPTVVFTAGGANGTSALFVNVTLYGVTVRSSAILITITPSLILTGVVVTPNPVSVQVSTPQAFTATPLCAGPCASGVIYEWNLTNTLGSMTPTTGPSGIFNAGPTAGNVSLFVNATLGKVTVQSMVDNITITTLPPQALSAVAIAPHQVILSVNANSSFTAYPLCGSGSCPKGVVYLWSLNTTVLGTLNTTYGEFVNFTAGTAAGNVSLFVNATLNGVSVQSSPASIEISTKPIRPLVSVAISPASETLPTGGAQTFVADPTCTQTCPSDIAYTWSVSPALGTFNSSTGVIVTFTAGSVAGKLNLTVNASYGSDFVRSAGAPVTITSSASVLTGIAVVPPTDSLYVDQNYTFTVEPTCTSGCSGVTYTWSLTNSTLGSFVGPTGALATFQAGKEVGNLSLFVNATLGKTTIQSQPVHVEILSNTPVVVSLVSVAISPSSAKLQGGGAETFTAVPSCTKGAVCPSTITYLWSLNASLGAFEGTPGANATFVAGNVSGVVKITVIASLDGKTVNSTADIRIQGTSSQAPPPTSPGLNSTLIALIVVAVAAVVVIAFVVTRRKKEQPPVAPGAQPYYPETSSPAAPYPAAPVPQAPPPEPTYYGPGS